MDHRKTIQDLVSDDSFVNWVNGSDAEDAEQWEQWIGQHPEAAQLVEDARLMVRGIPFTAREVPHEDVSRNWKRLAASLNLPAAHPAASSPRRPLIRWLAAAAFLLLATIAYRLLQPEYLEYHTAYGEQLEVPLPDGSTLLLNANSTVGFYEDLDRRKARSVELSGEAFFTIAPQTEGRFFEVRTTDLLVQVNGTAFNVKNRGETTIVSVKEGQVQLIHAGAGPLTLTRGQAAWYQAGAGQFMLKEGNTAGYTAWTEERWIFAEPTSLQKILERIGYRYGLEWEVKDSSILNRKLSGEISIESKEVLFSSLSLALDIEIREVENKMIIINRKD